MKRTIKFRGKMVYYDGWVYGNLLLSKDGGASIWPIESDKMGDVKDVGNTTIGQFTGLLDKNGKEIYEGDILKSWNNAKQKQEWIYSVEWKDLRWYFKFTDKLSQLLGMTMLHAKDNHEVIGNIYENPELLQS